jgi:hypothetical protein
MVKASTVHRLAPERLLVRKVRHGKPGRPTVPKEVRIRSVTARSLPLGHGASYLLRDRDQIFRVDFVKQVKAMGIQQVLAAPRSLTLAASLCGAAAAAAAAGCALKHSFAAAGTIPLPLPCALKHELAVTASLCSPQPVKASG